MTPERIKELREPTGDEAVEAALRECLDEIERLQSVMAEVAEELRRCPVDSAYGFRGMAEQLEAAIAAHYPQPETIKFHTASGPQELRCNYCGGPFYTSEPHHCPGAPKPERSKEWDGVTFPSDEQCNATLGMWTCKLKAGHLAEQAHTTGLSSWWDDKDGAKPHAPKQAPEPEQIGPDHEQAPERCTATWDDGKLIRRCCLTEPHSMHRSWRAGDETHVQWWEDTTLGATPHRAQKQDAFELYNELCRARADLERVTRERDEVAVAWRARFSELQAKYNALRGSIDAFRAVLDGKGE